PPGEEALIANMLGGATVLPDCRLVGCEVNYSVIQATYSCPDGRVAIELGHPQSATHPSTETAQFAITVVSGTPPRDFGRTLVSLVRSRESSFAWAWAESAAGSALDAESDDAAE